ncbi:uncharacterized protein TNCV_4983961 [Trichonephila clavipes]|nr:uncharacterized protein TNCV_4983961 [Trichonephila clavipes]
MLTDKMCPFDQHKILLYLKTTTLFDPTSIILIECVPNISQISMLMTNNRGFRPNHHTHFQHGLPPYPCKICTQQGVPNAYHWKLQCPFNQHQLKQTPFNSDPPLAANAVSQSSENSVDSQQIPNQRQHPLLRPLAQHIDNYKCPDTSHHCQA